MARNTKQTTETIEKNDVVEKELGENIEKSTEPIDEKEIDEKMTEPIDEKDISKDSIITDEGEDEIKEKEKVSKEETETNPLANITPVEIKEENKENIVSPHKIAGYGWNEYGF